MLLTDDVISGRILPRRSATSTGSISADQTKIIPESVGHDRLLPERKIHLLRRLQFSRRFVPEDVIVLREASDEV